MITIHHGSSATLFTLLSMISNHIFLINLSSNNKSVTISYNSENQIQYSTMLIPFYLFFCVTTCHNIYIIWANTQLVSHIVPFGIYCIKSVLIPFLCVHTSYAPQPTHDNHTLHKYFNNTHEYHYRHLKRYHLVTLCIFSYNDRLFPLPKCFFCSCISSNPFSMRWVGNGKYYTYCTCVYRFHLHE